MIDKRYHEHNISLSTNDYKRVKIVNVINRCNHHRRRRRLIHRRSCGRFSTLAWVGRLHPIEHFGSEIQVTCFELCMDMNLC